MNLHPLYAAGILLVGWFGFALRKSSLGGMIAGMVAFEGLLAIAAMAVFLDRKKEMGTGPVLLWVLFFAGVAFLVATATLALRQYYSHRSVRWEENEEIRH